MNNLSSLYPRHAQLWSLVAPQLPLDELAHDAPHVLRVYRWCLKLAKELGADEDLAGAAGLVHDLVAIPKNHPDRPLGGERSAEAAGGILGTAGYDQDECAAVVEAVRTSSWSRGRAPTSPVGSVLQDADRLDAIGAWGIARTFSTGQHMAQKDSASSYHHPHDPWFRDDRTLNDRCYVVDHFYAKLLSLAYSMHSQTARTEGLRRHTFMLQFLGEMAYDRGPTPAVLFDFDGTLIDSAPGILECLRKALSALGITDTPDERLWPMIGLPLGPSFGTCWGVNEAAQKEAVRVYREHWFAVGVTKGQLYEGVTELLTALTLAGRPLAIATAKSGDGAINAVRRAHLNPYFHAVAGAEAGEVDKHNIVARALASLPAHSREGALMVGDRRVDGEAAHSNGIGFVAVSYGYGSADEWEGLKLEGCAPHVSDLGKILGVS